MKNLLLMILSGSLFTSSVQAASFLAGPVYNPATTHSYFLLTSSSWTDAEAAAASLGGHLVTVNDAEENDWLLAWPAGWSLQTATNAPGPYSDIPGAAAPYTNDLLLQQQFF